MDELIFYLVLAALWIGLFADILVKTWVVLFAKVFLFLLLGLIMTAPRHYELNHLADSTLEVIMLLSAVSIACAAAWFIRDFEEAKT